MTRNEVFLVEGDSAGGSAKQGRERQYQAILPLKGKVLNTFEVDAKELYANTEVHDIAVALGIDPHTPEAPDTVLDALRYGKVIIMADADVDGAHIQTLLLTLFYRHFPKLIERGHVFIAQAPLYSIRIAPHGKVKSEKRLYALDDRERDQIAREAARRGSQGHRDPRRPLQGPGGDESRPAEGNDDEPGHAPADRDAPRHGRARSRASGVQAAHGQERGGGTPRVDGEGRTHHRGRPVSAAKAKQKAPRAEDLSGDLFSQPPAPPAGGGEPPQRMPDNPSLSEFASRAYLAYAMSVVKGRALPSVEDGQKPVQRRILYAMREMGNRHDAPFKKSARIVGDVIGKFHPHGDTAVYEAAVRMAQDFTLRYPLIEGQGNFGSRDGDSPAAMRYTEVRLTRFAEQVLLAELDRGTVDFADNYDGSFQEPKLLPARLPLVLLNGASGIAVGMATEIPPHNLREVAEACALTLEAGEDGKPVVRGIKGPDFPGGGQIISSREEIKRAYETGRGSVRVRARWSVEKLARGQYRVAVTQLPPNTSAARVLADIEEITNPKTRAGKKSLTPDQASLKTAALAFLEGARDDSDGEHPVRLVFEPRTSRVEPDELMAFLLAHTSMEANVALNLVAIGRDGRPRQMSLAEAIGDWAHFRLEVLERRLRHRADEVADRVHILDGRMIAYLAIEQVIKVIRNADEPKT